MLNKRSIHLCVQHVTIPPVLLDIKFVDCHTVDPHCGTQHTRAREDLNEELRGRSALQLYRPFGCRLRAGGRGSNSLVTALRVMLRPTAHRARFDFNL